MNRPLNDFVSIHSVSELFRKKRKEEKKYHLQMSCVFRGHVSITGCHVCLVRNLANKGFAVVGTNILSLSNEEFHRDKWGRGNVATEIWANPCAISSVSFDRGLRIEPGGDLHQYPSKRRILPWPVFKWHFIITFPRTYIK